MITRELQKTFNEAFNEAHSRRHEYLTLEHLLFAMLKETHRLQRADWMWCRY